MPILATQAHAFDVIAVTEQVAADYHFGVLNFAVGVHAKRGHDVRGEAQQDLQGARRYLPSKPSDR